MTISETTPTAGRPLPPEPPRGGLGVPVALGLLAVAAGWDLVTAVIPFHLLATGRAVPWPLDLLLSLSALAVYAGVLLLVSRGRARIWALFPVAVVAAVDLAMTSAIRLGDAGVYEFLGDAGRVTRVLAPVLLTAAWGLARRTGWTWTIGLGLTLVLAGAQEVGPLREPLNRLVWEVAGGTNTPYEGHALQISVAVGWTLHLLLPALLGGLAGWLAETATRRR